MIFGKVDFYQGRGRGSLFIIVIGLFLVKITHFRKIKVKLSRPRWYFFNIKYHFLKISVELFIFLVTFLKI